MRRDLETAGHVVAEQYPDSIGSMVAGSAARHESTAASDIDVLVIERVVRKPRKDNFFDSGKKIEVFVHSFDTLVKAMELDVLLRRACHISMCCDSLVLHEVDGCCQDIKAIARDLFIKGPAPLSKEDFSLMRHEIVILCEDLQDCRDDFERLILVANLTERCIDYYSGLSHTWQGLNRWKVRELRFFNPVVAEILYNALETFHVSGDLSYLFKFAADLLQLPCAPVDMAQNVA